MGSTLLASRRQYTSPGAVELDASENLASVLWHLRERAPDRPVIAVRVGDAFEDRSARWFVDEVVASARGLIALGIGPGDRVALHSSTRLEFTLMDYAIWAVGAVTVPLYETSSADQVAWILSDSGARLIICEDARLEAIHREVAHRAPECERAFTIAEGGLETLKGLGESVAPDEVRARADATRQDAVATIVYTSGTTGNPKGCVLTHRNLLWDAVQVREAGRDFFVVGSRTLLFLPLAHIFARIIQVSCIRAGATIGYSTGVPALSEELGMFRPDFLLAVPRVFQKVFDGARQKAADAGRARVFDLAAATAEQYSREQQDGRVTARTRAAHAVFDRLVYARLRQALGGRVTYAISGGAALGERLGHFFNGAGITVLEGYGLTETSAGATINRPGAQRIGTVGKPVPGASVRIADDGEVELAGPHVFTGYFGDDAATAAVLTEDGWFRTGDLGRLDGEGFLSITGRKKEIIVTAAGKNVAPNVLEDALRAHPLVSQAVVVGDARPFIGALVTLEPDAFERWASDHGRQGASIADLQHDDALVAELQTAVDAANARVSRAESIRAFRILLADFTVGVELSQKLSVRRHIVSERHAGAIEELYGGSTS
jgi:long-chain acyl-CoA synthetase